ncbi:hypothetical protein F5884DRAFT_852037 [Xylogone sp. PMI_703]|nr:hypothetical protein F5884DRAFT_852037 [Xylogone sp. PMI_703]
MRTPLQQLSRANRAIGVSLIYRCRRLYSVTSNPVVDQNRGAVQPPAEPGPHNTLIGIKGDLDSLKILKDQRIIAHTLQGSKKQPLHPTLASGYVEGGHLKRATDSLKALDENGLPTFSSTSIPIQFSSAANQHSTSASSLPHIWLRDNCRCSSCINQDTMQRAFDTFAIPEDITPKEVTTEQAGLRVIWANDGHTSLYPWDWLYKHAVKAASPKAYSEEDMILWGAEIKANPPSVHYDEIMADDKGVGEWTAKIRKYGFCYVDGCPVSPEKTEELLERIAFVRITHYGGFYDFTADLTMKDTAYTTLALQCHTDTTYFTDPAGLQMFHLLSHTEGQGGASLLVDGFKAASILKETSPESYEILSTIPVRAHASGNEGITITPAKKYPVFNFSDAAKTLLLQVRWNGDDRGPLDISERGGEDAIAWYKAARKYYEILNRKDMEYWQQLEPGRPLIFDNWRVMHGRSSFTGKRRICGGYVNHDDFISRWRNTNYPREEVLNQIL